MNFKSLWGKPGKTRDITAGQRAEQLAESFLNHAGLVTEARNYTHKSGEIDLIMRDDSTRVFVEVRLRRNRQFSSATESVTAAKQQKIIRAAAAYLQAHDPGNQLACRFDVIALSSLDKQAAPEWIKNAFDAI